LLLQVLLITDLKRSDSLADTDLFQYHNHFEFLGVIGATQLSEVFRVRHRLTDEVFAVKRSRRRFRTKLQRERCLREIRAVAELPPHVNIVSQYRAWQEGGHFYIQMDYCDGGSLGDAARGATRAGLPLGDEQLRAVARDVSSGLAFLHAHGVLHLDIKPENLYSALGAGGAAATWRIGDFGLAVAKDMHDWEEGDGQYVAPELLLAGCEPTPAADVFSLGATLFEAATGRKLPRREGSAEAGEVELPGRPQELVDLLRAMLRPDPAARPSAAQVLAALGPPAGAGAGAAQHTPPGARPPGVEFTFDAVPLPEAAQGGATPEQEGGAGAAPAPAPAPANLLLRNPHVPKWAPSLSPLVSEGALTPGAAAGLVGLTPPTAGAGGVGAAAGALLPPPAQRGAALRPPPLQLKPHQQQQPPLASARGPDSFRLRRRDMASPGREPMGESPLPRAPPPAPFTLPPAQRL
jgi:tRNA A-37 threonylcarbamoyl transferase component Bud32